MGAKHTETSIKLIEIGPVWHQEKRIGNKIRVLIKCGLQLLSIEERDVEELQAGA